MSYSIAPKNIGSWLHEASARCLAGRLRHDLSLKLERRRALFITLTYDRSRFASPQDLYRRQSIEQHVALFIRRLAKHLGASLRGKWIRKMEFQDGGWVHFHLVLTLARYIPHNEVARLWGWGFVRVERIRKGSSAARYLAKKLSGYFSKAESPPSWLLLERPRSVKIVSTSPGFWKGIREPCPPGKKSPDDLWAFKSFPAYRPIGESIEAATRQVVVRRTNMAGDNTFRTFPVAFAAVVLALAHVGVKFHAERGWWVINRQDADVFTELLGVLVEDEESGAAQRAGPDLNSTSSGNPDGLPDWLNRVWEETASRTEPTS